MTDIDDTDDLNEDEMEAMFLAKRAERLEESAGGPLGLVGAHLGLSTARIAAVIDHGDALTLVIERDDGTTHDVRVGATRLRRVAEVVDRIMVAAADFDVVAPDKTTWAEDVRRLGRAAVPEALSDEETDRGLVHWLRSWLREAYSAHPVPLAESTATDAVIDRDGDLLVSLPALADWLRVNRGERFRERDLAQRLRALGAAPITLDLARHGERVRGRYWVLPHTWDGAE